MRFSTDIEAASLTAVCGQLSASAALFRHQADAESPFVEPVLIDEQLAYGSDLVTTQRYRGKTNERLTRAMLNVALATAGINPAEPTATVLDPMCGRGTTLNWALAYGVQAIGIEPDRSALDQHATFLQTWAKRSRLPHKMQRFRPTNAQQRHAEFEVGRDRAALKAGGQRIETFNADGGDDALPIKRASVDVIVTDLPYGVQHRGAAERSSDDPPQTVALMERLLPAWHRWLRADGAVCLAWNTKRATRREISKVLATSGFSPVTTAGGYSMSHTVDATIDRDVIVATKS